MSSRSPRSPLRPRASSARGSRRSRIHLGLSSLLPFLFASMNVVLEHVVARSSCPVELEEAPPDLASLVVNLSRSREEGAPLALVHERRRQERVVDDLTDGTTSKEKRLARGDIGLETLCPLQP